MPEQTIEYRYDTQLLIDGEDLDEDEINDYFVEHFKGDCLLAVGDEDLIKIHYHTNEPWDVLKYCRTLGEIYDIVIEDTDRQARGLKGQREKTLYFFIFNYNDQQGMICIMRRKLSKKVKKPLAFVLPVR